MILSAIAGISLGFASWLHCIGMCGPLVTALHSASNAGSPGAAAFAYHAGRTATYIVLGLLFGVVADTARMVIVGSTVSIITGAMVMVMAVIQLAGYSVHIPDVVASLLRRVGGRIRRRAVGSVALSSRSFALGAVNGLLPCGVSLSAVIAAATLSSVPERMMFLLSFGVATSPALAALSLAVQSFGQRWRNRLTHASAVVMLVIGLLVLLRGMALDIPFVSPQIASFEGHHHEHQSCCHGPQK